MLREDTKRVNGKDQSVVVFRSDKFDDTGVYAVKRWCKVTQEGPADNFFATTTALPVLQVDETAPTTVAGTTTAASQREGTEATLAEGFDVDDDNAPAPENIPVPGQEAPTIGQTWGWDGMCRRRQCQGTEHRATRRRYRPTHVYQGCR